LQFAHLNSQVILGGTSMSVGELVRLEVGDVICLEKKVDEPCLVKINGEAKYLARPGRSGKHLAVVVNNLVDDVDELEGYGLE
jgi:flagellar motor switch protein FliM